ncbi:type III restriction-modification system endonuclease [Corynebacterium phoceense]
MELKFKSQQYQTDAVEAVIKCFEGQPKSTDQKYTIDPGKKAESQGLWDDSPEFGYKNAEITLSKHQLLKNIQDVQQERNLPVSTELAQSKATDGAPNLDIEMETGTGKTYVYIKTIMELNRHYGWSKFIVVVPSIAIREGVKKTFDVTANHFQQLYGEKPRSFVYNSRRLDDVEHFSSDSGIQVMIINIQAFNASGKDARRINEELDDFNSRKPIDVIAKNRPIVIIDEPQKIGAPKSLKALSTFNSLMMLRYSATHKQEHNKVHRLDALDAFNEKLVKRIAVRGISVKGLSGTAAYLYLESIEISKDAPKARIEVEIKTNSGIKRMLKRVTKGTNLYDLTGLEAYRPDGKAIIVTDVDAFKDTIELSTGDIVFAGQLAEEDVSEASKRRIQIREVINAHLRKERALFREGIKVLSLFFIDEVAKYRDYERPDTLGEYARVFEEEYRLARNEILEELPLEEATDEYQKFLLRDEPHDIHEGYFSVDKKTNQLVNGSISSRGDERGQSTDTDAYDLILRNKERLLSIDEPVRFIFSHSALREGWDNPNVFVMGMLKHSDNTVSRRQEIGRGLRIAVNQEGERQDLTVLGDRMHEVNELTVVTDESYSEFVAGLQKEIADSLSDRPRIASPKFFTEKLVLSNGLREKLTAKQGQALYNHLVRQGYVDDDGLITDKYLEDKEYNDLKLPDSKSLAPLGDAIWPLVDTLCTDFPDPIDGRTIKRNVLNKDNLNKDEFKELWNYISRKAIYHVDFDSTDLTKKAIEELDKNLKVPALRYVVEFASQNEVADIEDLGKGKGFGDAKSETFTDSVTASSSVKYDLLGEIAENTGLTRRTIARILTRLHPETFAKFRKNPEYFISEASRIIGEAKADSVTKNLTYSLLEDSYSSDILTSGQTELDPRKIYPKLEKHIYLYAVTDSQVEKNFATNLEGSEDVSVYAKLPSGFKIPTPVGDYNPDWAIAFTEGKVKHVYFVAETKGSRSTQQLKGAEISKIESARKFFEALNGKQEKVLYDVVATYDDLLDLVTQ